MINLIERVTHDGVTYEAGQTIEKIKKDEAQRLVDSGVAFFISSKASVDENSLDVLESINYGDLKEAAKSIGLDFPGNISRANLIELIVKENKMDDVLSIIEGGE